MVTSIREMSGGKHKGERTIEWHCYVSSLQADAVEFNAKTRAYWGIENGCHWVLDMTFNEDACRIHGGDGAQNFAILQRIALDLIKQEQSGSTACDSND